MPRVDTPPILTPPLRSELIRLIAPAAATPERMRRANLALRGRFAAVAEEYELGLPPDWARHPSADREWSIEIHKQEVTLDLALAWEASGNLAYVLGWRQLVQSWIAQVGTATLPFSDAQVEAKRIEHWLQSLAVLQRSGAIAAAGPDLVERLTRRIRDEARYVFEHLRPSRNHRTIQLLAVFMASASLQNETADRDMRWQAFDALCRNLLDDFGPDGVHIELSTHYHQLTLESAHTFARIAEATHLTLPAALTERLRKALEFSRWITLPDGGIPSIGDSDDGDHLPLLRGASRRFNDSALAWVASAGRDGVPPLDTSRWFGHAGYLCARDGWGDSAASYATRQHLFADFGELGAGSHAHYDLFNFCWTVGGERLVVDPGRFTYNAEADSAGTDWRYVFKRTAAHNTVTIDGRDQTRYLSKARRVAPGLEPLDRARHPSKHGPAVAVQQREVHTGPRSDWLRATAVSHEYTPQHSRLLAYVQRRYLLVVDDVQACDDLAHGAEWRLHLAPQWLDRIDMLSRPDGFRAEGEGWRIDLLAPGASCALESGWVSSSYGRKDAAPVLRASSRFTLTTRFVALLAPRTDDWAIDVVKVHPSSNPNVSEITASGHDKDAAWTDRFRISWQGPVEHLCNEYQGRSAFVHERRTGGRITHLLVQRPDAWTGDIGSTQGHIEW